MDTTLAKLYHVQHQEYLEDIPFWLSLAKGSAGTIVELGCGTGRITKPLLDKGHEVIGIDNDPIMLEFIRAEMGKHKKLKLLEADFTEFIDYKKASLVILPCNTFSTLSKEQRKKLISNVYDNLPENTVFCVSFVNPELINIMPDSEEPEVEMLIEHPETGQPLQLSAEWESTTDKFIITWHFDELFSDGSVKRISESVEHYKETTQEFVDEFNEAGFEIELFGGFEREKYEDESENLIIRAKK